MSVKRCVVCHRDMDGVEVKEDGLYYKEKGYQDIENDDVGICQKCAKEQRVVERAKKFREELAGFVKESNSTMFNSENITAEALVRAFTTEHRYLQNEIALFLFKAFRLIAELPDNYVDGRNEWAFSWFKAAVKSLEAVEITDQLARMTKYEGDGDAELTLNGLIKQAQRISG